jgi:hypothetical protein
MNIRDGVKHWLRMCGHAFSSTVHERLDDIESQVRSAKLVETQTALLQASVHMIENLHALAGRAVIETGPAHVSPQAALAAFLYSYVPHRAAIEIIPSEIVASEITSKETAAGNQDQDRRTTLALAEAGYDVYRLSAQRAGERAISGRKRQASAITAGAITAAAGAPSASGAHSATVGAGSSTKSTSSGTEPAIPGAIGIMNVGGDALAVLNEIGDFGACVIVADLEPGFEELAAEMRGREYHWHVAVYRAPSRDCASYFANYPRAIPDAEGSVFFFRDYRVFAEAQAWCAATLPRTYFKPPQD